MPGMTFHHWSGRTVRSLTQETEKVEMYKQTFSIIGAHGAYTKTFRFEGPSGTKDRNWVDLTITAPHGRWTGTLSLTQARALSDELRAYFGFDPKSDNPGIGHNSSVRITPRKAPNGPQAYKGNGKHTMEQVSGDLYRLRVPGGWLYFDTYKDEDSFDRTEREVSGSTTFVPVPEVVGYKI